MERSVFKYMYQVLVRYKTTTPNSVQCLRHRWRVHEAMVLDSAADIRCKSFTKLTRYVASSYSRSLHRELLCPRHLHGISLLCLLRKFCIHKLYLRGRKRANDQTERRRQKKRQETDRSVNRLDEYIHIWLDIHICR
jgi:hypothetical protein